MYIIQVNDPRYFADYIENDYALVIDYERLIAIGNAIIDDITEQVQPDKLYRSDALQKLNQGAQAEALMIMIHNQSDYLYTHVLKGDANCASLLYAHFTAHNR